MEICFLRFGLPSSWACEKGHQKRIFSKTLSRVEIFENAVFPQSWGWVKHEEVFENDYVTGSDTSKCPCPNKSHYCAFVWTGKNDPKTQRVDADFLKTWCRRDDVSRYFWKRGFCLRFSTPSNGNAIVIIPFYSNQSNVVLVDAYFLENGEKTLGFQKYPDTCGPRASERIYVAVIHATQ